MVTSVPRSMSGPRALSMLFVGIALAAIVAVSALLAWDRPGPTSHDGGELRVYFLDVDQGDAILIQTPDSKNIMVDCGYVDYSSQVIDFLKDRGIGVIDAFIATHPDPDHIGSAPAIFEEFQVLRVYHSGFVKTTRAYLNFIEAIESEDCQIFDDRDIDPGDLLPLSSNVTFEVLAIDSQAEDSNDASIVLRLSHGTTDIILEGDASWRTERKMIERWGSHLDIEVLKVSHHGSSSASSTAWLEATTPETAVVCVGPNDWGLPNQSIMDRLEEAGADVLTTDGTGGVLIVVDGSDYSVTSISV